jgi:hypothetical protein
MQNRALLALMSAMSVLVLSSLAGAQDVDVPGNLTMVDSTDTAGNILKGGVPFLHNFGLANTFLGSNAGNLSMSGVYNTGTGSGALQSNVTGNYNTAIGVLALSSNITGTWNTAVGSLALFSNTDGQVNTACGYNALASNTTGTDNTATGFNALTSNITGSFNTTSGVGSLRDSTGSNNTASGYRALFSNITGGDNTAIGFQADVSAGDLTNATAIGSEAVVDASNKIRLGNSNVTVIEGQVGFTASSDRNQKENFKRMEGETVLTKIRGLSLTSWNFIGQDAHRFRHYGPVAQEFFGAFGDDGIGTIGTPTTITSTDMEGILMAAAQALEKRSVKQEKRILKQNREMSSLRKEAEALRAETADIKARLAAVERRIGSDALTKVE